MMNDGLSDSRDVISNAMLAGKISRREGHSNLMRGGVCEMAAEFWRTRFAVGKRKSRPVTVEEQKQKKKQKPHAHKTSMGHPAPVKARAHRLRPVARAGTEAQELVAWALSFARRGVRNRRENVLNAAMMW